LEELALPVLEQGLLEVTGAEILDEADLALVVLPLVLVVLTVGRDAHDDGKQQEEPQGDQGQTVVAEPAAHADLPRPRGEGVIVTPGSR